MVNDFLVSNCSSVEKKSAMKQVWNTGLRAQSIFSELRTLSQSRLVASADISPPSRGFFLSSIVNIFLVVFSGACSSSIMKETRTDKAVELQTVKQIWQTKYATMATTRRGMKRSPIWLIFDLSSSPKN